MVPTWIESEDATGLVCVNMHTGTRFRPHVERRIEAGTDLLFPNGHVITLRTSYAQLRDTFAEATIR